MQPSYVEFELTASTTKCTFEYTIIDRSAPNTEEKHIKSLKEAAVSTIRRFSHYKHISEIRDYVDFNFTIGDTFANGRPLEFYSLVHEGIMYFEGKKNIVKNDVDLSSESSESD